ncbi:spermidine/putrescine transport system permease protein [Symbiobacterium terraclitae]|uniref:Spermidine/putrescine transport system permease protein n=1 Tax=Symbiobacterium terraclitae TaxID=557451 RepID=A0ABS4JPF5_9FIRM|nr:ABC transporter permease [Symbiobacterium terraclitae]MBP2017395.1 spermidine/putrescine transport system permease protein [Symbiobacterium terraclitae]
MTRRGGWAALAPTVLWLTALVAAPLALMLIYSLAARIAPDSPWPQGITLQHYARLVDPLYLRIFIRSILQAALATFFSLLLGYPLAYYIARSPLQKRGRLLLLVVIPFWTNFLVRTYALMVLMRAQGVINSILTATGLIREPLSLLYNEAAVQVGLVYTLLPLLILPLYANLEKLDERLLSAAQDLGASPFAAFWHVTWPLSRPGVLVGCMMVFISAFGMYLVPDLMGGARSVMVGNLIQNQFLQARNWPFGAAVALALTGVVLVVALLVQRAGRLDGGEVKR